MAVLGLQHLPVGRPEGGLQLRHPDARHDSVERLAVGVHDQRHVAQPGKGGLHDGLPDVALVELGVADDRDEPASRPRR